MKKPLILFALLISIVSLAQNNTQNKDTLFDKPYVDIDEWREIPVKHHYVHGGFKGTDTRFSFYFPPKEQYQGRFFQYITPVPDSETLSQGFKGESDKIGFSIASGAYFIETNGGGASATGRPGSGVDPTIGAYRANAACAQYSRVIAEHNYGKHRTFGYAFGGSGGAYRTIGSIENTEGVWDGVVPFVIGSPMAIPNVFTVRMHAMRILKEKLPQIADALEPGGSGDVYEGLNPEEKSALIEVTKMGFPIKAWFNYKNMGIHAFPAIYVGMLMADKQYFDDFWKTPGYLGSNPPSSLLKGRIQYSSKIKMSINEAAAVKLGISQGPLAGEAHGSADSAWKNLGKKEGTMPIAFQLDGMLPDIQFLGGDLVIKSGAAAGKTLLLTSISGDKVVLGSNDLAVLALIKSGDEVQVDNSNFLAAQTYHRHQVPGKEYPEWDQFRDNEGKPIYPQRPFLLGPLFAASTSGSIPSGKFKGKMIVLESLWDSEAFPWQADWYLSKVKDNLGSNLDDNFRLWFTDHANHADFEVPGDPTHLVSYLGVLHQALRDLSAWVEKGIAPPMSTNHKIVDGQVDVPSSAAERKGIQPIIELNANGSKRAQVKTGQPVVLTATVEVPPHAGKLVKAEWDFEGTGKFPAIGKFKTSKTKGSVVTLKTNYVFSKPGTYFCVLRVSLQREGDTKTPYALIKNLERVRVVVQ